MITNSADRSTALNKDDPPPMNFNYDDYKLASSRRNENTVAPSADALKHAAASAENAAASPTAFILDDADAVRVVPFCSVPRAATTTDAPAAGLDPPRMYAVRVASEDGGSSFVVCRRKDGAPTTTTT